PKTDIFILDPEEVARLAYVDPKISDKAAARAGADKYHNLAILNRIASARFGWQPRFFNPRLERWLHRVKIPTHIIWGDGDRIIPPAYARAFHRPIPPSPPTPRGGRPPDHPPGLCRGLPPPDPTLHAHDHSQGRPPAARRTGRSCRRGDPELPAELI